MSGSVSSLTPLELSLSDIETLDAETLYRLAPDSMTLLSQACAKQNLIQAEALFNRALVLGGPEATIDFLHRSTVPYSTSLLILALQKQNLVLAQRILDLFSHTHNQAATISIIHNPNEFNDNSLMWAASLNTPDLAHQLLSLSLQAQNQRATSQYIHQINAFQSSALIMAAHQGHICLVERLITLSLDLEPSFALSSMTPEEVIQMINLLMAKTLTEESMLPASKNALPSFSPTDSAEILTPELRNKLDQLQKSLLPWNPEVHLESGTEEITGGAGAHPSSYETSLSGIDYTKTIFLKPEIKKLRFLLDSTFALSNFTPSELPKLIRTLNIYVYTTGDFTTDNFGATFSNDALSMLTLEEFDQILAWIKEIEPTEAPFLALKTKLLKLEKSSHYPNPRISGMEESTPPVLTYEKTAFSPHEISLLRAFLNSKNLKEARNLSKKLLNSLKDKISLVFKEAFQSPATRQDATETTSQSEDLDYKKIAFSNAEAEYLLRILTQGETTEETTSSTPTLRSKILLDSHHQIQLSKKLTPCSTASTEKFLQLMDEAGDTALSVAFKKKNWELAGRLILYYDSLGASISQSLIQQAFHTFPNSYGRLLLLATLCEQASEIAERLISYTENKQLMDYLWYIVKLEKKALIGLFAFLIRELRERATNHFSPKIISPLLTLLKQAPPQNFTSDFLLKLAITSVDPQATDLFLSFFLEFKEFKLDAIEGVDSPRNSNITAIQRMLEQGFPFSTESSEIAYLIQDYFPNQCLALSEMLPEEAQKICTLVLTSAESSAELKEKLKTLDSMLSDPSLTYQRTLFSIQEAQILKDVLNSQESFLLSHKIQIKTENKILFFALKSRYPQLGLDILILLMGGKDPNQMANFIHQTDEENNTVLMLASQSGQTELAYRLVALSVAGMNKKDTAQFIHAVNHSGCTALSYAADAGNTEIMSLLIEESEALQNPVDTRQFIEKSLLSRPPLLIIALEHNAIKFANHYFYPPYSDDALSWACLHQRINLVKQLLTLSKWKKSLEATGDFINRNISPTPQHSCLLLALEKNEFILSQELLGLSLHGSNPLAMAPFIHQVTPEGMTSLMLTCQSKMPDKLRFAKELIRLSVKGRHAEATHRFIHGCNHHKQNALSLALVNIDGPLIQLLLEVSYCFSHEILKNPHITVDFINEGIAASQAVDCLNILLPSCPFLFEGLKVYKKELSLDASIWKTSKPRKKPVEPISLSTLLDSGRSLDPTSSQLDSQKTKKTKEKTSHTQKNPPTSKASNTLAATRNPAQITAIEYQPPSIASPPENPQKLALLTHFETVKLKVQTLQKKLSESPLFREVKKQFSSKLEALLANLETWEKSLSNPKLEGAFLEKTLEKAHNVILQAEQDYERYDLQISSFSKKKPIPIGTAAYSSKASAVLQSERKAPPPAASFRTDSPISKVLSPPTLLHTIFSDTPKTAAAAPPSIEESECSEIFDSFPSSSIHSSREAASLNTQPTETARRMFIGIGVEPIGFSISKKYAPPSGASWNSTPLAARKDADTLKDIGKFYINLSRYFLNHEHTPTRKTRDSERHAVAHHVAALERAQSGALEYFLSPNNAKDHPEENTCETYFSSLGISTPGISTPPFSAEDIPHLIGRRLILLNYFLNCYEDNPTLQDHYGDIIEGVLGDLGMLTTEVSHIAPLNTRLKLAPLKTAFFEEMIKFRKKFCHQTPLTLADKSVTSDLKRSRFTTIELAEEILRGKYRPLYDYIGQALPDAEHAHWGQLFTFACAPKPSLAASRPQNSQPFLQASRQTAVSEPRAGSGAPNVSAPNVSK